MTKASNIRPEASGMDVLHLNVSGKTIAVLRSTLTRLEGSMLAARFSGRWDDSLEKDRDGNFFINQPADLFVPMIDFLQRIENSVPMAEATRFLTVAEFGGCADRFEDFADMVEHYGMTPLVLPPTIYFAGEADEEGRWKFNMHFNSTTYAYYVRMSGHYVEARQSSFFELRTRRRDVRRIRSFEVTIDKISTFCIGWGNQRQNALIFDSSSSNLCYKPNKDLGIPTGLQVESGSVIRCELLGSDLVWSVKGQSYRRPRDSTQGTADANTCRRSDDFYLRVDPTFGGKGTWWVSRIEF
jgi:BTB/POZ domain